MYSSMVSKQGRLRDAVLWEGRTSHPSSWLATTSFIRSVKRRVPVRLVYMLWRSVLVGNGLALLGRGWPMSAPAMPHSPTCTGRQKTKTFWLRWHAYLAQIASYHQINPPKSTPVLSLYLRLRCNYYCLAYSHLGLPLVANTDNSQQICMCSSSYMRLPVLLHT